MQASYLANVVGFRGEPAAGRLPAGHHALTREVVLASQRGRLLDAMAQAVAAHGYGSATVAHVVALAGVSRKTFYEHFRDKEDCFLALYDTGIGYVLGRIAEALSDEPDDVDLRARVAAGLAAFLGVLAEEPAFSRAIILEVHAAGGEALARRRATLEAFAARYEDLAGGELPHDVALALVGAILELTATRIADGRAAELPELAGTLTAFVVRNLTS